jgi:molecular chaperone DnaJ
MENYFTILGVSKKTSIEEVKKAYRLLASKYHPDKHQDSEFTKTYETKFNQIKEAYDILSDSKAKKEYIKDLASEITMDPKSVATEVWDKIIT